MSERSNPWILQPELGGLPDQLEDAPAAAGALSADAAGATSPPPPSPPPLLLCFAPAGSSAGAYSAWRLALPDSMHVLPVELPGHGGRMREAPLDGMDALMRQLVPALAPLLQGRRYALFGHSMGAWVACQLVLELQCTPGATLPLKVYASANRAPQLAGPEHDVDPVTMHLLPDDQFWAAMERRYGHNPHLTNAGLRHMLLPTLRADFRLIETWRPAGVSANEPPRLHCAVAALGGTQDPRYTQEQLGAWRDCVSAPSAYEEHWFEGGHSYATAAGPGQEQLLQWLSQDLQRQLLSTAASEGGEPSLGCGDGAAAPAEATTQESHQPPQQQQALQRGASSQQQREQRRLDSGRACFPLCC